MRVSGSSTFLHEIKIPWSMREPKVAELKLDKYYNSAFVGLQVHMRHNV